MYSRRGFLSGLIKSVGAGLLGKFAKQLPDKKPAVQLTDAQKKQVFMDKVIERLDRELPFKEDLPEHVITPMAYECGPSGFSAQDPFSDKPIWDLEQCGELTASATFAMEQETKAWDQLSDDAFVSLEDRLEGITDEHLAQGSLPALRKLGKVAHKASTTFDILSDDAQQLFECVKTSRGDLYLEK